MNLSITGGNGIIGSYLCQHWLSNVDNIKINSITRNYRSDIDHVFSNQIQSDLSSYTNLKNYFKLEQPSYLIRLVHCGVNKMTIKISENLIDYKA